ncbi:hypothetical protein FDECE_10576 [Fusarium decemcellulare]|nr:hypothetical protein FDECE_10576 [Fusarium decemcellulare]
MRRGYDPARHDVHKLLDDGTFAIAPKQGRRVVNVLLNSRWVEIRKCYHNLDLQLLTDIRTLIYVNSECERPNEQQTREFSAKKYQMQFPTASWRAGSRQSSPEKVEAPSADDLLDEGFMTEGSERILDSSMDEEHLEEGGTQFRKRRRLSDSCDELLPDRELPR